MKKQINDILIKFQKNEIDVGEVSNSLESLFNWSADLAYLTGVFNVAGLNGCGKEIKRLQSINRTPHELFS